MRLLHAARLSQDTGESQTGIDSRDKQVQQWAAANGHTIIHTAADKKSGTVQPWNRPSLKPWVTEPQKIALYDGIVAAEFDRLSRGDKMSTNEIEKWAHDHGKMLITVDGLVFPSEGMEGAIWDFKARQSHQEWLNTSKRYKRMQGHLRDSNFLVGKPAWFMQVAEKDNHKTLVPHPVNAEWARKAIERYLAGESYRQICKWLDCEGVKTVTGGTWSPVSLGQLLRNESLIGRRKDSSGKTILKHDPIISRETWDRLQAMLDQKASRKGVAPKQSAMLTSIAVCSLCGGPMYRIGSSYKLASGQTAKKEYYRCHGTDRDPSTCGLMVSLTTLDAWVSDRIMAAYGAVLMTETVVIPGEGYTEEIAELERDIRELDLDDPQYDSRFASLRAERSRLKALPNRPTRTEKRETGKTIAQEWEALAEADRRPWMLGRFKVIVGKPVSESQLMLDSEHEIEMMPSPFRVAG